MWRSVVFQLAATVGPLLGGFVIAWWHSPALVYLVDAASSLFLFACMPLVKVRPHQRDAEPKSWRSFSQGLRFLRRQPIILSTMTLDMVAVLFGGATALLPIYATDVLGVGAEGFGWMRAMPSLGAICMGLLLAIRPPFEHGGRALLAAVTVFGIATIVFGVSTSYPLSLAALFVLGAADNVSVVIRATVLQLLTPDSMRGRVSAVSIIFIGTSNEIGEFESGVAAQWMGLVPSVVFGGTMTLTTVAVVAAIWPALVRLGSLEHLQPPDPVEVVA
jgi:MFS family permease